MVNGFTPSRRAEAGGSREGTAPRRTTPVRGARWATAVDLTHLLHHEIEISRATTNARSSPLGGSLTRCLKRRAASTIERLHRRCAGLRQDFGSVLTATPTPETTRPSVRGRKKIVLRSFGDDAATPAETTAHDAAIRARARRSGSTSGRKRRARRREGSAALALALGLGLARSGSRSGRKRRARTSAHLFTGRRVAPVCDLISPVT